MLALPRLEKRLIEILFRHDGLARVDLAKNVSYDRSSVSRAITKLVSSELVSETRAATGQRGQPRKVLSLNTKRFKTIGVSLRTGGIEVVVMNLAGEVLASKSLMSVTRDPDTLARLIASSTLDILKSSNTDLQSFLGMGVSVPGNFGQENTTVHAHSDFPAVEGAHLRAALERELAFDIFFENDGAAAAVAEFMFGLHSPKNHLCVIHLGYGLGGGAILNGEQYRGARGNSCLFGSLFPYDSPRPTLTHLREMLTAAKKSYEDVVETEGVSPLSDATVCAWVEQSAQQLREATTVISGFFDPEVIVIAGPAHPDIRDAIATQISLEPVRSPSLGVPATPVIASKLGFQSGLIGAASIPFFSIFFP